MRHEAEQSKKYRKFLQIIYVLGWNKRCMIGFPDLGSSFLFLVKTGMGVRKVST